MGRHHIVAWNIVVLSLALVVACGGGDGGGGAKTATATRTSAKTPAPRASATAGAEPSATGAATQPGGQPAPTPAEPTQSDGQPVPTPSATPPPAPQPSDTPPPAGTTIAVSLREFSLALAAGTALSGLVTFSLSNDGTIPHDFAVIMTDLAPDALPVDPATYQVRLSGLNLVRFQPPFGSGASVQVPVDLPAGNYVLICNVASHYQAGMRVGFVVQ